MKTYPIVLLCFIFSAIIFSSCQKEISTQNEILPLIPPTSVTGADSTYLDKIVYISANGTTNDTTAITYYNYDAQKRVSFIQYTSLTGAVSVTKDIMSYAYNAGDTIPFRSEEVVQHLPANDTFTSFFTYTAAAQRLTDSVIYYSHFTQSGNNYRDVEKGILRYEFPGLNFYASETYYELAGDYPGYTPGLVGVQKDTGVVDISGNLLTNKRYAISFTPIYDPSVFTYDNHPNPFRRLSNAKAIDIIPFGYNPVDLMQAANNRLSAYEGAASGSPYYQEDLTGRYTYRTDGYPKEIDLPNGSVIMKTIFIYRNF